MRFVIGWAALFLALPLCAQVQEESQAPVRTYNLLRENDDWSFLAEPSLRSDFWDPIKYIPLGCEACYVSLGGEIRQVFEGGGSPGTGSSLDGRPAPQQPWCNSLAGTLPKSTRP